MSLFIIFQNEDDIPHLHLVWAVLWLQLLPWSCQQLPRAHSRAFLPQKEEPELMYKLFSGVCVNIEELLDTLKP